MPFTLEQLDFLALHFGLQIPTEFIENKRRAQEFKTRLQKLAAQAGSKPADWQLRSKLDEVLKRAADSASQQEFVAALKLLDEAEQVLQQPDSAPASSALPVWRDAKDQVDGQLDQLYDKLKKVGLPVFEKAASQIETVLASYRTSLVIALTEYDSTTGEAKQNARANALKVVQSYQQSIPKDKHVLAADNNIFGVKVTICDTLGAALTALSQQLGSA